MKNFIPSLVAVLVFFSAGVNPLLTYAQTDVPPGEKILVSDFFYFPTTDQDISIAVTKKRIWINGAVVHQIPYSSDIVHAGIKLFEETILALLQNGLVLKLTYNSVTAGWEAEYLDPVPGSYFEKIVGDDLYAMAYNAVYVSDAGYNWVIDTAGLALNGAYCNDIAIDNNQQVWLATQNGLFTQQRNVTTWVENTNYPSSDANLVYVDRAQTVWVSRSNLLRFTSDNGQSFQNAPPGLPNDFVRGISDDAFGNMYVMYDSTLYYSQDGTQPFVKVSGGIPGDMHLFSSQYLFNDISGDTLIYLATEAGVYTSDDQGSTWIYQSGAAKAEHVNSVAATDDNRLLMTSNVGAFRREGEQNWSKRYPQNGFIRDTKIYTAANGDIYLLAEAVGTTTSGAVIKMVYKSTDDGTTFLPDTAGIGAADVAMSTFFTDENGMQHASGTAYIAGTGNRLRVWKKLPGQSWETDTVGLPPDMNSAYFTQCFGTGHNSKVYLAISNFNLGVTTIYSRPIAGGSWTSETAVFGTILQIKGREGIVMAGTETGIIYNTGGGWTAAATPSAITATISWSLPEVDNNGVAWGYFETIDNGSIGLGVYYTTDFTTWHEPEGNVDTILFGELVAIGDSVFALSAGNDGVYVFDTTHSSIPVSVMELSSTDHISVIPNPFSTTATLQFNLDADSKVTLTIYNVIGQTLFSIPAQQMSAGPQQMKINLPETGRGLLLYELRAGDVVYKGKMVRE